MKKIIVFALAIMLLLTLTACGGGVSREEFDRLQEELSRLTEGDGNDSGSNSLSDTSVDTPVETSESEQRLEPRRKAEVGDNIEFAGLIWRVLEIRDDKVLIVTDDAIEERPYNENANMVFPWEGCDLRAYLNGDFFNNTFSAEEKARIVETTLTTEDNPETDAPGGNDTVDKVFLLSFSEAEIYLAEEFAKDPYGNLYLRNTFWRRNSDPQSYNIAIDAMTGPVDGVRPAIWITGASSLMALASVTFQGVEYSVAERFIRLEGDDLTNADLEPLKHMTNLRRLDITAPYSQINDLSSLAGLNKLERLYIECTEVTDISPLTGLIGLEDLVLTRGSISDLTPLSGLTNLWSLDLSENNIGDLAPIAGLVNLSTLIITENQISDISPLAGLTNLHLLEAYNNQISDVSPLAGLKTYMHIGLSGNPISDWSPLNNFDDVNGRP